MDLFIESQKEENFTSTLISVDRGIPVLKDTDASVSIVSISTCCGMLSGKFSMRMQTIVNKGRE